MPDPILVANTKPSKPMRVVMILLGALSSLLYAQQPVAPATPPPAVAQPGKEEPPPKLSFILLGEQIRKTYKITSGGIDEVEGKPGENPPSRVLCKSGDVAVETMLSLNAPSGVSVLKSGARAAELCECLPPESDKPDAKPRPGKVLANVPIPYVGKPQTAFLFKKDPMRNWQQDLEVMSLTDDPEVFPARSVRVLNVSRAELFVQIGDKQIQLGVGKSTVVPTTDAVVPIIAAVRHGQGFYSAVKTSRKLRVNDRLSLVVYNFDGEQEPNKTPPPVAGALIAQPVAQN